MENYARVVLDSRILWYNSHSEAVAFEELLIG